MTPLASLFVFVAFKVTDSCRRYKDSGQDLYEVLGIKTLRRGIYGIILSILMVMAGIASAQERGPVTNLPIPRFVSIKASEANVRRGPSLTHRVDWVFQARDLPVEITAEHGHWRRVSDRDGVGGWVHHALLSGVRTAIVNVDLAELHTRPEVNSSLKAQLERNVIGRILSCDGTWCRLQAGGYRGWVLQTDIWGAKSGEIIE